MTTIDLIGCVAAYLMGSVSTAVIVARLMHLPDPRKHGSHNPGATNVLRLGGKKAAIFTLLGDVLKGFLPVFVFRHLGATETGLGLIMCLAFLGHLFPIFFGFKGGKGVATALGVVLGVNPGLGGILFLTWVMVALISRYSSLAALVSAVSAPIYGYLWGYHFLTWMLALMSVCLIIRHRANIARLMQGAESRIF